MPFLDWAERAGMTSQPFDGTSRHATHPAMLEITSGTHLLARFPDIDGGKNAGNWPKVFALPMRITHGGTSNAMKNRSHVRVVVP